MDHPAAIVRVEHPKWNLPTIAGHQISDNKLEMLAPAVRRHLHHHSEKRMPRVDDHIVTQSVCGMSVSG
ncbi:hypothetical protein, partial [Sphingobium sp. SA916]|uniref:hypothetical protein n=1 Tax=Sphingobium sp. SA916 TaxID=1851207 RepID=UPI001C0F1548